MPNDRKQRALIFGFVCLLIALGMFWGAFYIGHKVTFEAWAELPFWGTYAIAWLVIFVLGIYAVAGEGME